MYMLSGCKGGIWIFKWCIRVVYGCLNGASGMYMDV